MKAIYFYFTISLFFTLTSLTAQESTISITGKIIEKGSNSPMEFVTVMIADNETKKTIAGTTSSASGDFKFTTTASNFYIEVSFIGFQTQKITDFKQINNQIKLGTISLSEDATTLSEFVVGAEKSQTVFKLDKRVFNVGTDLSSTGASALEILNNVPSVNVNIEGQISLRGSQGVQVLINGKPSVLASDEGNSLGTITADMIESIEVITNPSAKYDAEGTSGIINIIMKKSEKKGLNGSVTLNTGIPNNHSVGFSINRRTEKFNLFSQIGYGRRTFPNKNKSVNTDKITGTTLTNIGESDKNEEFFNLILGADYHINDLNVITFSGNYAYEDELEHSNQNYSLQENQTSNNQWTRDELTTATNPKWEYEMIYKKDFKNNKKRNLLFSATGRFFGKDQNSLFTNTPLSDSDPITLQRVATNFKQEEHTFKLDYTHPVSEKYTFETGAQYVINNMMNDYSVDDYSNNTWINNTAYSNLFNYTQSVFGAYATAAYEADKWGIKGGLRFEDTDLKTVLVNTNENHNQNYYNFFPSIHTSYKMSANFSLQAGYSKRIFRPRLWDLNPFPSLRDVYNISTGNPNLLPEFTNSFEISSIYKLEKASFNASIYHRATENVVERITLFDNNISTTIPLNIGTNNATGLEFNMKYNPNKWFTFMSDFNLFTFNRKGSYEQQSFDFTNQRWTSRATGKFKLPANFTFEVSGNYQSKYQTVQGTFSEIVFMDLGIRKKIMKGKLTASLSVRDVFQSRIQKVIIDQPTFYRESSNQRGRFITFGLSFGFGKGEAMEFSGQKRH